MKQKYLVYTLFGLLAVNMSWNLGSTKTYGEVNLASLAVGESQDIPTLGVTIRKGEAVSKKVYDARGKEITSNSIKVTIEQTEGDTCACLKDQVVEVELDTDGGFKNLAEVLKTTTEKLKKEDQEKKDKEEIAKKEQEEKAKKDRLAREEREKNQKACKLEERQERMDCHAERLSEISDEIKSQGCRTSSDKECNKLIEQYEAHKDAIVGYIDELIAESQDEDKKLAKRASSQLKALKRSSSSVVKKTVNALLNTEENFSQTEDMYHRIPELMRASLALSSTNPMLSMQYGQEAYRLEQQLKYMVQNSDVSSHLNKLLDNNYIGGLGEDHVNYFMERNSALRKALNIQSIYPTQIGSQALGNNSTTTIVPQSINFRGNGFSGSSGVPSNSSTIYANAGQINLSQLPVNSSIPTATSSSTSTLIMPTRIQSRN